jgi:hypothetical protein
MLRLTHGLAVIGCLWTLVAQAQIANDAIVAAQAGADSPEPIAATRNTTCVALNMVDNRLQPPDLYQAVGACVSTDHLDDAVRLFIIAGALWRFDAQRMTDPSATLAGSQLVVNTFAPLPAERRSAFKRMFDHMITNHDEIVRVCRRLEQMGTPQYFPRYMVLSGARAFNAQDPYKDALIPNFDGDETWNKVLHEQIGCPAT